MGEEAVQVDRLLSQGVLVLPLHREGSRRLCYVLHKPASAGGNSRPQWEHEISLPDGDLLCDAPCGTLERQGDSWVFCVHEFTPEPGPGDFCREFPAMPAAVDAVLAYYFGDPSLMNPPAPQG